MYLSIYIYITSVFHNMILSQRCQCLIDANFYSAFPKIQSRSEEQRYGIVQYSQSLENQKITFIVL